MALFRRKDLDPSREVVIRKPFKWKGINFRVGEPFPWEDLNIPLRKLRMLHRQGLVAHPSSSDAPKVVEETPPPVAVEEPEVVEPSAPATEEPKEEKPKRRRRRKSSETQKGE